MTAAVKRRFDLAACKRHSDVTGCVAGAEPHQHTFLLVRARGFDRRVNIAGIFHTLSSDLQNHVTPLESAIRSCTFRLYRHDDDAFTTYAAYLARRGDRQAQPRNDRAMDCSF